MMNSMSLIIRELDSLCTTYAPRELRLLRQVQPGGLEFAHDICQRGY